MNKLTAQEIEILRQAADIIQRIGKPLKEKIDKGIKLSQSEVTLLADCANGYGGVDAIASRAEIQHKWLKMQHLEPGS